MVASAGVDDSGIVGDVSVGVVFVMLISCCKSMLEKAKIPMTSRSWGFDWFWGVVLRGDQRRYLSEKARSRVRGSKVCLITIAPALLVRVLAERVAFLLDHCQVGVAVMSIIGEFSFFRRRGEKAQRCVLGFGLWLRATMKIIHTRNPPRFGPRRGRDVDSLEPHRSAQ